MKGPPGTSDACNGLSVTLRDVKGIAAHKKKFEYVVLLVVVSNLFKSDFGLSPIGNKL